MKNFCIFDEATGRIIQSCVAVDLASLGSMLTPGRAAIETEGEVRNCDYYVESADAVMVPLEPGLMPIPPQPSFHHRFDFDEKVWIDPRDMPQLRAERWAAIKAARDAAEFGGFAWGGLMFDSDSVSQSRLQGAIQLAAMAPDFAIDWTLQDNSVRELDSSDLAGVGLALGQHVATQHAAARGLRARIDAANTPAQLQDIKWQL